VPPTDLLFLSARDVTKLLPSPSKLIDLLESMFRHKAAGKTQMPPKLGIHPLEQSFIHAMPACVSPLEAAGIKWISAYPNNSRLGLPQISGLIILNDLNTGLPRAVLDASAITAARTAAASALAARYLARKDSHRLGILGCGVQAQSHLATFASEFELHDVFAYDSKQEISERFAQEMEETLSITIHPVREPKEAVLSRDLVITAGPITNPPHATIKEGWLAPGAFASSIDYGSYWHPGAIAQMDLLFTDDCEQYVSHQREGYLQGLPAIEHELSALVTGQHPGRTDENQRTFACNLGIALEDIVVAKEVVDLAITQQVGRRLKT
jgi:ornithine cyclodeaminase/alanine dehydrogenase-like protein (mu-crystallin family)